MRTTTYSKESINAKLEKYRDLFLNSGAWQRMVDNYKTESLKPCLVEDLTKEISYIEDWYAKRFDLMDAYFGIDTGIATTTTDNQSLNNDIYSIQGVKLNEAPAKGLYIQGGKLRMK